MNNYCVHLKKRENEPYCSLFNKKIMLSECRGCVNKEYKKNAQKKKNIVHKSKRKRITVSKETYNAVIERDKYCCRLCGSTNWLALHHIEYRSERRDLINDSNNCIMLCEKCHRKVHSNKKQWQPILLEMNKIKKD